MTLKKKKINNQKDMAEEKKKRWGLWHGAPFFYSETKVGIRRKANGNKAYTTPRTLDSNI